MRFAGPTVALAAAIQQLPGATHLMAKCNDPRRGECLKENFLLPMLSNPCRAEDIPCIVSAEDIDKEDLHSR